MSTEPVAYGLLGIDRAKGKDVDGVEEAAGCVQPQVCGSGKEDSGPAGWPRAVRRMTGSSAR